MMTLNNIDVLNILDKVIGDPVCELNYNKDYELLIATVLSAQSTDKRVNLVTEVLFSKYDIKSLSEAKIGDIERIIKPVGTYHKKAVFIKEIAVCLVKDYDGRVPNNREYLEALPGVGRKTCNVVLSHLFAVPAIAVDTHVERVSKRLGLANINDDVSIVEKKLMKKFPKEKWSRLHLQLVLFGRYLCKSKKTLCDNCEFKCFCKYNKTNKK